MSLPITRDTLAAAYDYLRTTPPFCRWNLPEAEDVVFKVARTRAKQGWYQWNGTRHTITGSQGRIGQTLTLIIFMAHEMVHLHLEAMGWESSRISEDTHNAAFRKFAAQVCKHHGFDPKSFF